MKANTAGLNEPIWDSRNSDELPLIETAMRRPDLPPKRWYDHPVFMWPFMVIGGTTVVGVGLVLAIVAFFLLLPFALVWMVGKFLDSLGK